MSTNDYTLDTFVDIKWLRDALQNVIIAAGTHYVNNDTSNEDGYYVQYDHRKTRMLLATLDNMGIVYHIQNADDVYINPTHELELAAQRICTLYGIEYENVGSFGISNRSKTVSFIKSLFTTQRPARSWHINEWEVGNIGNDNIVAIYAYKSEMIRIEMCQRKYIISKAIALTAIEWAENNDSETMQRSKENLVAFMESKNFKNASAFIDILNGNDVHGSFLYDEPEYDEPEDDEPEYDVDSLFDHAIIDTATAPRGAITEMLSAEELGISSARFGETVGNVLNDDAMAKSAEHLIVEYEEVAAKLKIVHAAKQRIKVLGGFDTIKEMFKEMCVNETKVMFDKMRKFVMAM